MTEVGALISFKIPISGLGFDLCYAGLGHCGGSSLLGSSAMTLRDAQQIAHGLIQGYIGPDHRVIDMSSFYSALAQALQTAYRQGKDDRASER
jgi:hypothetical protein